MMIRRSSAVNIFLRIQGIVDLLSEVIEGDCDMIQRGYMALYWNLNEYLSGGVVSLRLHFLDTVWFRFHI